ncbi:LysR family transcriptional regulator [Saccharopolyspora erythraea]|uniref:LysR family transcriptional regulator n=1 Tax=Saccharopolyspora erythraea TaxID=1836 RepID=UPI0009DB20D0|nr:LysR family transcriptional regulator [Saccharopolyspora erythraea]QRK92270.1 LysR family transcriptional regulator [Saccharopolyspora erythraea]
MFPPALLRTFLAVAQTRSFTQASQRLGVRQSTVSQHVRKLEQLTSRPLFTRDTHSVALTPDGEAMVGFARSILEANERAASYFAGSQLRGRLRNLSASRCAMGQSRSQRCGIREADPFSPSPSRVRSRKSPPDAHQRVGLDRLQSRRHRPRPRPTTAGWPPASGHCCPARLVLGDPISRLGPTPSLTSDDPAAYVR